jgi:Uma2 family endonuclease
VQDQFYEGCKVAVSKVYTVDDFEVIIAQAENTDKLLELINGEIIEKVPPQLHALIASLFNAMLFLYVQKNPIGWVFSELRIKLPGDDLNDRLPDVALVLKEGRTFEPDAPLTYVPDLVVEIQSPGQSDKFMLDKATFFLNNGGKMVWIVYPAKRLVEVLTLTDRKLLTEADVLEGGDLLPGFTLLVKDIFTQK